MREMEFKPLQKRAYEHIKSLITGEQLEYGVVYSESKIALDIGISRTPVRDAVHRLYQEGYLEIIPNKGFQLHQIDEKDVYEIYEVRSAVEGYCAKKLAKDHSKAAAQRAIAEMQELLEQQREIFRTTGGIGAFVEKDNRFHLCLVSYSGNEAFIDLFRSYMYKIKKLSAASLAHEDRMRATLREHAAIWEAIRDGDADRAYEAVLTHMDNPLEINLQDIY